MLNPISNPAVSDDEYAFSWLRGWIALDQDNGAYLLKSGGMGRGGNQAYYLIAKGTHPTLLALSAADFVYRKRIVVNPFGTTQEGLIAMANEYLQKWLDKQGVGK